MIADTTPPAGDDITYGYGTSDDFYVSAGNDVLHGLDGDDTYRFGGGAGNDIIDGQFALSRYRRPALAGSAWSADDDIVQFLPGISKATSSSRAPGAPDLLSPSSRPAKR